MSDKEKPTFALILSGGGARGAYEAGIVYYIRTKLPKEIAESTLFKILCGTSVGAINTTHMAATAADPLYQGAYLRKLWMELTAEDIYFADTRALTGFLVKSGFFMATNFFGLNRILGRVDPHATFPFRSVLDTTPFITYMRRTISFSQIHRNISRRLIDAITISASHLHSGDLALFVEKHPDVEYSAGGNPPLFCNISPRHVLASAAIPIIFPSIRINRQYFADGGMRQNTPMSPAIHLGADRLLVISLRNKTENNRFTLDRPAALEPEPEINHILGHLLNTIFLDKIDYDLDQMRRINFLIQDMKEEFGDEALVSINKKRLTRRIANKELTTIRPVVPFVISPSEDIGVIAADIFEKVLRRRTHLNPVHRFFANVVEAKGDNDFMSYMLFEPDYLKVLVQLGFEDAQKSHDHLTNFFLDLPLDTKPTGQA